MDRQIANRRPRRRSMRRGTTTVEFALIAIPLFMFLFASVEFGRATMAMQCLEEAARAGCRTAILGGATEESVSADVDEVLAGTGISNHTVEVTPEALDAAARWTPVTVRVTASFNDMSWLPLPIYLRDMSYTASCTLPREANTEDE